MTKSYPVSQKHHTDSLCYQLEQTTKYCRAFCVQMLEKYYPNLTLDELSALDIIRCNGGICQRDLAKLLLKDRANTGRLLESLEKKELIVRSNDTKNNRLVRKVELTENGLDALKDATSKLGPVYDAFIQIISEDEIAQLKESLKKLSERISQAVNLQI